MKTATNNRGFVMMAAVGLALAGAAAHGQVVSEGLLNDQAFHSNTLPMLTGSQISNASGWDFWTFNATAGDNVDVEVNRLVGELDPVSSVVFGDATGLQFGDLVVGDIFSWTGPSLSSVIASGDDNDGPALPGPWGDPHYGFIAPSTGVYTLAISSFASAEMPQNGYGYEVRVQGNHIPTPSAAAVLGLGGLCGMRRRRAR